VRFSAGTALFPMPRSEVDPAGSGDAYAITDTDPRSWGTSVSTFVAG
jgi:hypothetical protein